MTIEIVIVMFRTQTVGVPARRRRRAGGAPEAGPRRPAQVADHGQGEERHTHPRPHHRSLRRLQPAAIYLQDTPGNHSIKPGRRRYNHIIRQIRNMFIYREISTSDQFGTPICIYALVHSYIDTFCNGPIRCQKYQIINFLNQCKRFSNRGISAM